MMYIQSDKGFDGLPFNTRIPINLPASVSTHADRRKRLFYRLVANRFVDLYCKYYPIDPVARSDYWRGYKSPQYRWTVWTYDDYPTFFVSKDKEICRLKESKYCFDCPTSLDDVSPSFVSLESWDKYPPCSIQDVIPLTRKI